jgi:hypothetical protein
VKPILPALVLGIGLSTAAVTPSTAYPIDCAILLCLAGGFPASPPCARAKAEFIRRITPWPIEPPLQIWNCPMRASFPMKDRSLDRLWDVAVRDELTAPAMSFPERPVEPMPVDAQADIDISDAAFDFVRSIRVFEITYRQQRSGDDNCFSSSSVHEGSYGAQGDYTRKPVSFAKIPATSAFRAPTSCSSYSHRSVFVEWRDFEGTYGHEEVHY